MAVRTRRDHGDPSAANPGLRPGCPPGERRSVVQVGDGIARIYGLSKAMAGELLEFPKADVMGIALNLEEESVGVSHPGPIHRDRGRRRGHRRTGRIARGARRARRDRPRRQRARRADRRQGADRDEQSRAGRSRSRPASSIGSRSNSRCRRASRRSTR